MSILEVKHGDLRLGWDSPIKEVVHPKFISLPGRDGLGWLEGFSEWLVRCGLEFSGHPGKDEFTTFDGSISEMQLTLHGKIGNTPASEVKLIIDKDPPHTIRLRGLVHERVFHGPKLELWTEISTVPGSVRFSIDDTITNYSALQQEYQLVYHINYGTPLLENGAKLIAPVKSISPINEHAAKSIDNYATYPGPTNGFIEEVFLIDPFSDKDGNTTVLLQTASGEHGTSISWSTAQLPYLTQWKNSAAAGDGYVTGLEPGTGFPLNRRIEREFGRVPKLPGGASASFHLNFDILVGKEAVSAVVKRVEQIKGDRDTQLHHQPPEINH
jgi:hypothetical protein